VVLANEDVVGSSIGVEPVGKVEGGLDEEELIIGVPGSDRDGRERGRVLSPKKTVSGVFWGLLIRRCLEHFISFVLYVYFSIFLRGITGRTPLKITWKSRDSTSVRI